MQTCPTARAVMMLFGLAGVCLPASAGETAKTIRLWDGPAPGARGDGPEHVPSMADAERFPQGENPLVVEITPSGTNEFNFDLSRAKP